MRLARVSGFTAVRMRHPTAERLDVLTVAKKALALGSASSAAHRSSGAADTAWAVVGMRPASVGLDLRVARRLHAARLVRTEPSKEFSRVIFLAVNCDSNCHHLAGFSRWPERAIPSVTDSGIIANQALIAKWCIGVGLHRKQAQEGQQRTTAPSALAFASGSSRPQHLATPAMFEATASRQLSSVRRHK